MFFNEHFEKWFIRDLLKKSINIRNFNGKTFYITLLWIKDWLTWQIYLYKSPVTKCQEQTIFCFILSSSTGVKIIWKIVSTTGFQNLSCTNEEKSSTIFPYIEPYETASNHIYFLNTIIPVYPRLQHNWNRYSVHRK
jgi:hypothetical protein